MFNILHLSDLHFGRNYDSKLNKDDFINKERIMEELVFFICNLPMEQRPQHVLITGDIAWKGKEPEFNEAYEWFSHLMKELNLTGSDFSFCVGNHDINRSVCIPYKKINIDDISAIDRLYSFEKVNEFEPLIYNYNRFCERIGTEPYEFFIDGKREYSYTVGYKDIILSTGEKLRVLSFNTSMLMLIDEMPRENMWLGLPQIKSMLDYSIIPNKDSVSIALFHHAERYLAPNETCEYDSRPASLSLLRKHVDLCLCGHTETGGLPVLIEQTNGGKLLSAGATYYSDKHPNSFSLLRIVDKKTMQVLPFYYKGSWRQMHVKENYEIKTPESLEPLGEIYKDCELLIKSEDGSNYQLPIKRLSVYSYPHDNETYVRITNKKEVTRHLDITYDGPIKGGTSNTKISIARTMINNLDSMLYIDNFFYYVGEKIKNGISFTMDIRTVTGNMIVEGVTAKFNINEKYIPNEWNFKILDRLIAIEKKLDIKLLPPEQDIFESDISDIEYISKLLNDGFIDLDIVGETITTNVSSKEQLKVFIEHMEKGDRFVFISSGEYQCKLFQNSFSVGKLLIVIEGYQASIEEIKSKLETFQDNDIREIIFRKSKDGRIRVFHDIIDNTMITSNESDVLISIGKMNIPLGCLFPEE